MNDVCTYCDHCHKHIVIPARECKSCYSKAFRIEDWDGDNHVIYALDAEEAALSYAKRINEEGDYNLLDNTEEIKVNGKFYRISAEPDIYYTAEEVDHDNS